MNKDILFTDMYISKFEDGYSNRDNMEMQDEVQIKVENFETGTINVWSSDKFTDKLMMMRDAL